MLFCSSLALPAGAQGLNLRYEPSHLSECGVSVYGHSRHTRAKSEFNEDNTGLGVICYSWRFGAGTYVHVGRMYNSYRYLTNFAGMGYKKDLLCDPTLCFGAGVEVNYLKYGIPAYTNSKGVQIPEKIREGAGIIFPSLYSTWDKRATLNLRVLAPCVYLFSLDIRW